MWMWAVVLVVVVTVPVVAKRMDRRRGSHGASRTPGFPGTRGGRASGVGARIKRQLVVVAALLCAVVGMPQMSSAAGSYGAVVEKGFRGCTTAPESGVVICFQSPTVNSRSGGMFLQAWRAADLYLARWDSGPATMFVRAVIVSADSPPALTYVASADLVMPQLACREEYRFRALDSVVRLESVAIACTP